MNEIGIEARVHASRSELWPLVPDPLIGFALIASPFTQTAVGVWHWAHCVHDGRDDDGLPEFGALYVVDVLGCHGAMVDQPFQRGKMENEPRCAVRRDQLFQVTRCQSL